MNTTEQTAAHPSTLSATESEKLLAALWGSLIPQMTVVIDDLLDHAPDAPKELVMRAKKLLPGWAPHSFEQSPPKGRA